MYDRAIASAPLRSLIGKLFTDGIAPNPSNNLQVTTGSGMTVTVQAGFAICGSCLKLEENARTLAVQASDANYDRIDTVVLRLNTNDNARYCDLYVVQGIPSTTPVRPALTRTSTIWELGLADVFVAKNSGAISTARITDTRYDATRCGVISSISEFDTTTIYNQVQADLAEFKAEEQADFLAWYERMRNQLSEDAAGNLQQQIDAMKDSILNTMEEIEANTQENQLAGAKAVKELSQSTEDSLKVILDNLSKYLPLIGGKLTGKLQVGDNIEIESNGEGGNIRIKSPNGTWWEIDCFDNTEMRIFGDSACENSVRFGKDGHIACTGDVEYGNGNKLSDVGQTSFVKYIDNIGNSHTHVQASVGIAKLSRTSAIITVNYYINANDGNTDTYSFIDMDKLRSALGLSRLNFVPTLTNVIFKPSIELLGETLNTNTSHATANEQGFTGIMLSDVGELGRIYDVYGNFGGWNLASNIYGVGTYGTIVINGATIA